MGGGIRQSDGPRLKEVGAFEAETFF